MRFDDVKKSLDPENLTPEDIKAFRERYKANPVLFCLEILGLELDKNQVKIAESVRDNRKTACISARGTGKSVCISALAIWFFTLSPNTKVICGANTHDQSYSVLWLKILELIRNSCIDKWFEVSQDYIYWDGARDLGYIHRITCGADKTENISGFHSPNELILLDEASSIPDRIILNLIAGLTEANNKILLSSNPTRNSGVLAEANEDGGWNCIHINGYDSRFTNKAFLDELVEKYGRDSDTVRVQVFGEFPKEFSDAICTSEVFRSCVDNVNARPGDVVMGLDVASSGGDLSVWCIRRGGHIIEFVEESSSTVESLTERTIHLVDQFKVDRIFVDATGLGWGVAPVLQQNLPCIEIHGINFAEKAPNDRCSNYRAYMYMNLADAMKRGDVGFEKSLNCLAEVREELTSTESKLGTDGKIKLEPKEKIREKLGRSPDRSDSLALTFATEVQFMFTNTSRFSKKSLDDSLFRAGLWG